MSKRSNAMMMVLIMTFMSLSGRFGEDEVELVEETSGYFDFIDMLDGRTWYHYPGGVNAQNNTSVLGGNNICLLYTSPSPRDQRGSRMPSSA